MSKKVKHLITNEYAEAFKGIDSACVVSVIGLDAISTNQVRGQLRSRNIRLQVIKNSLARRALADGPLAPLAASFDGPCAVATGGESVIDLAKMLLDLQKTHPAIELKQGIIEGDPDLVEVAKLAKMKGRMELLSDVAGAIQSPAASLAACLVSPGGRLAGCIETLADNPDGEESRVESEASKTENQN